MTSRTAIPSLRSSSVRLVLVVGFVFSLVRSAASLAAEPGAPAGVAPAEKAEHREPRKVDAVPTALRESLHLAPFYTKHVDADGFPVLGSAKVSDAALLEGAWVVDRMLEGRTDIRRALVERKVRLVVMATSEMTTDVPEHADLKPKGYWDRRARGLGASLECPVVSCGEENLLGCPGDPYATECILVHEFAHTIHEIGLRAVDRGFQSRLDAAYHKALAAGLWKSTYAATNASEYWAEGVQSWFDTNRQNDPSHNHVNTRKELEEYDAGLAALLREVLGDRSWTYEKARSRRQLPHLSACDFESLPAFRWPEGVDDRSRRAPRKDASSE